MDPYAPSVLAGHHRSAKIVPPTADARPTESTGHRPVEVVQHDDVGPGGGGSVFGANAVGTTVPSPVGDAGRLGPAVIIQTTSIPAVMQATAASTGRHHVTNSPLGPRPPDGADLS